MYVNSKLHFKTFPQGEPQHNKSELDKFLLFSGDLGESGCSLPGLLLP